MNMEQKKKIPLNADPVQRLIDMLHYLRQSPDGCVWTREQTHQSLTPYLIEESYETADTIDQGKTGNDLRDELGDMLLQIVYHSEIAAERGAFTFDDVAQSICDKLERRYPSIFGNEENNLKTAAAIEKRWEEIKEEERKKKGFSEDASILDDISHALPALLHATKLKGRAAKAGWDWPDPNWLLAKITEEMTELKEELDAPNRDMIKIIDEYGDLMFVMVDFARWHGFDAEDALRRTNNRFERRFRHMESALKKDGRDIKNSTREQRWEKWNEAKKLEKKEG